MMSTEDKAALLSLMTHPLYELLNMRLQDSIDQLHREGFIAAKDMLELENYRGRVLALRTLLSLDAALRHEVDEELSDAKRKADKPPIA